VAVVGALEVGGEQVRGGSAAEGARNPLTSRESSEEGGEQVRGGSAADGARNSPTSRESSEEAILLAHQLRLVCGEERAGCKEWAQRVFETGFGECALKPASFVVQQVQSDGSRATAYVDVVGAVSGAAVKRRVEVARVEGAWRVVTPLEALCGAEGGG
jgi:hypothetical protein